jgi:C1A family cysteine protease
LRKAFKLLSHIVGLTVLLFTACLFLTPVVGFAGPVDTGKISFQPGDDLALIRTKIAANGYDFKVASNWVIKLPRPLREKMRLPRRQAVGSLHYATRNLDPGSLQFYRDQALPERFDLRSVGPGRSYIGPVRQQGSCGACYAFSACAAAEATYNLATGRYNQNCVDFSEAFIAFCLTPLYGGLYGCGGSDYDYEELDALVEKGVCYEEQMPYESTNHSCPLGIMPPTVHFNSWHRLPCNDTTAIKTAILNFGAVDAAISSSSAFDAYASGIYEDSKVSCESSDGGSCYYVTTDHVVALIGWDNNNGDGFWILRNSWGREWGENGYMRIKYHSARVACAACYLVFTPDSSPPSPADCQPGAVYPCLQLLLDD